VRQQNFFSHNVAMKTIFRHDSWPIQPDILNPRLLRLTSRKQLRQDMQPADIKSHNWRHNWKSAQVVNSHLVWDPTIRQPGFDLPRKQWSLLNHFCTELGLCSACGRKWWLTDIDLCPCGESCPLTELNGSLSRLLCRWRRCLMADQLWFMTSIREEERMKINITT